MDLLIFNEGVVVQNWLQIYAGLKHSWLGESDIFKFITQNKVACTDDRHVELYLAFERSRFELYDVIKKFIKEDLGIEIILPIDDGPGNELYFPYIPAQAWRIWELEFLLRVKQSGKSVEDQIYMIYIEWMDFKYFSVDWSGFLWLAHVGTKDRPATPEHILYTNFLNYIETLIKEFKKA